MAASAGTVTLNLDANSVKLMRELQKAERGSRRTSSKMQKDFEQMGKRIGVAVAAVAAAFAVVVRQQINVADQMGKSAQKIGVSTEALSQLEHVAKLSGSSFEGLQKGLLRLSRTASDAQNGLATAARSFDQLRVSAQDTDGTLKDTDQLLLEIADRFSQMEDGAKKAALAQELFGKAGAELIPMLNQGRAGIEALKNEADALGLTISGKTAAAAEAFNDNLTRLQSAGVGFARQLTGEMLPALELVSEKLAAASIASGGFTDAAEAGADRIVRSLAFVMDAAEGVRRTFMVWGRSLAVTLASVELGVWQLADSIINGPGRAIDALLQKANNLPGVDFDFRFGIAIPEIEAQMARAAGIVREGAADIQDILMAPMPGAAFLDELENRSDAPPSLRPPPAFEAITEPVDKARGALAALANQVATFGLGDIDKELAKLANIEGMTPQALEDARQMLQWLQDSNEAAATHAKLQSDIAAAIQSAQTPAEAFVAEIQKLNDLREGGLDPETYERLVIAAQEGLQAATDAGEEHFDLLSTFAEQAARNIQDSLAQFLFDPFDDGLKGMLSGFIDTMRRMVAEIASQAILRSLFGGFAGQEGFLGAVGNFVTGKRATGGPVSAGGTYLVGERGPELLQMGSSSGNVVPNHALGGQVVFNIDARGADAQLTRALPAILEGFGNKIKSDIRTASSRGRAY